MHPLEIEMHHELTGNDDISKPLGDYVRSQGWRCAITDPPEPETPVIACAGGFDTPMVLELRWEICNPMIEGYFKDFLYWDDPNNDGQDFEGRVYAWQECPDMPEYDVNPNEPF